MSEDTDRSRRFTDGVPDARGAQPRRGSPGHDRTGFRQAAPVVAAAALIVFSLFAGFAPAGEATIKSIAFALAAGILFDAFVVRAVLVPAALALLGGRAWWLPRRLQWLPVLDVERAALEQAAAAGARREPAGVAAR